MKRLFLQFVILGVAITGGQALSQIDSAKKIFAEAEKLLLAQPNFGERYKILESLRAIRREMAQDTLVDIYKDRIGGFDDEIDVKVFKGGKLPSLTEAALRAVYKTRWKPARIGQGPADVWVSLPVRFNLEKK